MPAGRAAAADAPRGIVGAIRISVAPTAPSRFAVNPICREWALPHRHLHGLWEALVFDIAVKQHLLQYATSALFFADKKVDPQLVTWNRWGPLSSGRRGT